MMSNRIFGQSASVKEGNGWSVTPVLQLFRFVRFFIVHLIIYVCVRFLTVYFLHFCIFSGGSFPLCRELHLPFQQDGMQCPDGRLPCRVVRQLGEYPFGMFLFTWQTPGTTDGKLASRFSAIRRDGERQLYIFSIRRGNIRSCISTRLTEAA